MKWLRDYIQIKLLKIAIGWRVWLRLQEKQVKDTDLRAEVERVANMALRAYHIKVIREIRQKKRILAELELIALLSKMNQRYAKENRS